MLTSWFENIASVPEVELANLRETLELQATQEQQAALAELAKIPSVNTQFERVLVGSKFASQWLCKHPGDLIATATNCDSELQLSLPKIDLKLPLKEFDQQLRLLRNRAMAQIIWHDLNRLHALEHTTCLLTQLAEWAIQLALEYHYAAQCEALGTPKDETGAEQPLLVLGLGKLGAWELNLSSDVDLMFAYPEKGETQGGRKSVSNQEFFTRVGQGLIKSLDAITQDGFVFRVDMRLRPYGNSGALVSSFDALEDYYQTQGREWERFAMIKARVVASTGKAQQTAEFMNILTSFSYRRYVDYSAIDALRNLKQLINREVARRRLSNNIKLGRGGIREVEFIAQAFQIIRGGRDTELQERRLLKILPLLETLHCLPVGVAQKLIDAYIFLRNLEHAVQAQNDEQTQNLPSDPLMQQRLALALGFESYAQLVDVLQAYRNTISEQFQAVIAEPAVEEQDAQGPQLGRWVDLWLELCAHPEEAQQQLEKEGFEDAQALAAGLAEFIRHPKVMAMDAPSKTRLDAFMPRLLKALKKSSAPVMVFTRVVELLKAVVRRSAYLLLLTENPGALNQLLVLVSGSPWIAEQLAAHPALLDELLDPATLYHVPSRADLDHELRQYLLRIPADDLEQQMEGLRYFRSAHALRVAACEITERLPLMRVSDYLTELAEVILAYVMQLAWLEMVARHGYPDGEPREIPQFIIVGYGKLGGIELGHGSDLDLVFIHDANPQGETSGDAEGKRKIDNLTFYMRMGQKIIHIMNTQTLGGQLYEVDMRLRPSGNSGLLVASFNAFDKYQNNDAWTWEHQALVRARAIAGDSALMEKFNLLRSQILQSPRNNAELKKDVVEMRAKMRDQLGSNNRQQAEGLFALKQDAGGIVDIEFMVQYAVLAWSHVIPALARFTDNIRILGCLEESSQLPSAEVHALIDAYKAYRSLGHRLALQQTAVVVEAEAVAKEREAVQAVWQRLMLD